MRACVYVCALLRAAEMRLGWMIGHAAELAFGRKQTHERKRTHTHKHTERSTSRRRRLAYRACVYQCVRITYQTNTDTHTHALTQATY